MILPQGTFNYEAVVEEIRRTEIILGARSMRDGPCLGGPQPRICVDHRRIAITANSPDKASVRQAVFIAGDAVFMVIEPDDHFYVSRTGCGSLGVSLIRHDTLVVAFGAVTSVPLGTTVNVERGSDAPGLSSDTWVRASVNGETESVRARDEVRVGSYDVYMDHSWNVGEPGIDECMSISLEAIPKLKVAAMRSAILSGHDGGIRIVRWDQ